MKKYRKIGFTLWTIVNALLTLRLWDYLPITPLFTVQIIISICCSILFCIEFSSKTMRIIENIVVVFLIFIAFCYIIHFRQPVGLITLISSATLIIKNILCERKKQSDRMTQTMLSVIGGIPMGIGIFAVWPLAKKFGKRNLTLAGFILYALGSAICWMFPTNMVIVLIGQFIKNIGGLPCSYVFMALFADVLDHMEYKHSFRVDGIAMSIYNIIAVSSVGICTGVFNLMLSKSGYVAPSLVNGLTVAAEQTQAVKNTITFAFVGLETITGIILAVLLIFLSVEKNIHKEQAVIKERKGLTGEKEEIDNESN